MVQLTAKEPTTAGSDELPAVVDYRLYEAIKEQHPNDLVLFQVGYFFELYGADARQAAKLLDLHLTTRPISNIARVEMCDIPSHALKQHTDRLREQFDVTIIATQEGLIQRNVYTLPSREHEVGVLVPEEKSLPTVKELFEQYKPTVRNELMKDTAFVNACLHSDRENAYLEGAAAIRRVIDSSGDLRLIKLYYDLPAFHNRLHRDLLDETYPILADQKTRDFPRYQVAAYHHIENGFDDKRDYHTLERAEEAAQGYVNGTMEADGFVYDGAAVYDTQEKRYLRVYGDYPDEKAQAQAAEFTKERDAEQPDTAEPELPPFLDMHLIEANLLDDGGRKHKRQEIFDYFQAHKNLADRTEFLKNSYNDIWVEVMTDGVRSGYHAEQDGLLMWEGSYLSRTSESVFSWAIVTEMTENLMERGEYKIKLGLQNAPVIAEQLTLFGMGAEEPAYEVSAAEPAEPLFPGQQVPQAVIDRALYTAGNEYNSAFRVAAFYMREHTEQENIAFLKREFGTENGRGIEYEDRKYAVWFMEDGIHLAQGDSVRTGYRKTLVTWEQASARILELLEAGTYLSAGELEQVRDKVLHEMADSLLMTARELTERMGLFPQALAIHDQHKGYPALFDDVVAFAKTEGGLETLAQEYHSFLSAYYNDPTLLRFRLSDYNTHRIGVALNGLELPERHFTAQPDFMRQCKMFITQDEIDQYFLRGDMDSRLGIYSHFCYPHTPEEHQKYIKNYYGEYSGGSWDGYSYTKTAKGLTLNRRYTRKQYGEVDLSIPNIVKEYEKLIAQKRFPGEDAIAKIPQYERHCLAGSIYNCFYGVSEDVPRPYPQGADYFAAVPIIEAQLEDGEKAAEILNTLQSLLDGMKEDDRYYEAQKRINSQLSEYINGTFSLFNHRHDGLTAESHSHHAETAEPNIAEQEVTVDQDEADLDDDIAWAMEHLTPGESVIEMEGKSYRVTQVNEDSGMVRLQDAVSHSEQIEPISYVRHFVEQRVLHNNEPAPQHSEPEQPQTDEPSVLTPPRKKSHSTLAHPLSVNGTNYRITDDHIGEGTPLERFQNNLNAIRLLKTIESEESTATPEEQSVLAQYVGWGGLADFFDEKNPRYGELKELLTDAEYTAARESTLTAFYTPPVVIRGIYQALAQMGFTQGNILEPACGIGNFLGMLPENMADSKLYGVELDDLSGRMARQLYQQSGIAVQGYRQCGDGASGKTGTPTRPGKAAQ